MKRRRGLEMTTEEGARDDNEGGIVINLIT